jgi:hypothetical protein
LFPRVNLTDVLAARELLIIQFPGQRGAHNGYEFVDGVPGWIGNECFGFLFEFSLNGFQRIRITRSFLQGFKQHLVGFRFKRSRLGFHV